MSLLRCLHLERAEISAPRSCRRETATVAKRPLAAAAGCAGSLRFDPDVSGEPISGSRLLIEHGGLPADRAAALRLNEPCSGRRHVGSNSLSHRRGHATGGGFMPARARLPNHAYSGGEHSVPSCSSTGSGRGRSTPFLTNRDTDAG